MPMSSANQGRFSDLLSSVATKRLARALSWFLFGSFSPRYCSHNASVRPDSNSFGIYGLHITNISWKHTSSFSHMDVVTVEIQSEASFALLSLIVFLCRICIHPPHEYLPTAGYYAFGFAISWFWTHDKEIAALVCAFSTCEDFTSTRTIWHLES